MGFYNVINPLSMQAGQPEDISQVLANLNAIAGVLNGSIDNSNIAVAAAIARSKLDFGAGLTNADIAPGAAIDGSKLASNSVTSAQITDGTIQNADISAVGGITGDKIATGTLRAEQIKFAVCSGWWYYSAPPADYSNRFFASAGSAYSDNGGSFGGAMMGSDGIIYIRKTARYFLSGQAANNHGAVTGSYCGIRIVLNGVTDIGGTGGHVAATADTDAKYGMFGGAHEVLALNAGDYVRAACWSSAGYPLYVWMTLMEWPY